MEAILIITIELILWLCCQTGEFSVVPKIRNCCYGILLSEQAIVVIQVQTVYVKESISITFI